MTNQSLAADCLPVLCPNSTYGRWSAKPSTWFTQNHRPLLEKLEENLCAGSSTLMGHSMGVLSFFFLFLKVSILDEIRAACKCDCTGLTGVTPCPGAALYSCQRVVLAPCPGSCVGFQAYWDLVNNLTAI